MAGNIEVIESVSRHIQKRIGRIAMVFHEIVSDELHIDVYHVRPSWPRRFQVLVTSGMSARPMSVPDAEESPFAEIAILLPRAWPLSQESFSAERNYWPVRLIKSLARFPHENDTWLGFGHTVPGSPDLQPFAPGTVLCAAMLVPSMTLPRRSFEIDTGAAHPTRIWTAVPIHATELDFARNEGTNRLLDLFDTHRVSDVVDPSRPAVV